MALLKKIPFFPFLLVVFFCLHGSVENFGYIGFGEVLVVGVVTLAWVAAFFAIILWISRNYVFASLVTFFIALWYLFFGAIQDWVNAHQTVAFMQRFSVLIPVLVLATVAWIIFLKKKKLMQPRLFLYFNILMLIYCVIDTTLILKAYYTRENKTAAVYAVDQSKIKAKPNVYLLLFDEYAGYKSLKDSFGFANDSIYDFLKQQDFRMVPTFSNYDFTLFSMSAILNMKYMDTDYTRLHVSQHDLQMRTNEIRNAAVVNIFKNMGYHFRNYSIFDVNDKHSVSDHNAFIPVHSLLLTDKILHNRVIRNSGWLLKKFPLWKREFMHEHDLNNQYSGEMVLKTASDKKDNPVFCYAHFIMPHGPFYRDSLGRYNPDEMIDDETVWPADRYLSYLKYTNHFMRKLVGKLVASDPGAIVIVASDHGYRSYKNTTPFEPFNYNNICALRFPDGHFLPFRDNWSMVNLFPYLFNSQFGQNIPYLPDNIIVLSH